MKSGCSEELTKDLFNEKLWNEYTANELEKEILGTNCIIKHSDYEREQEEEKRKGHFEMLDQTLLTQTLLRSLRIATIGFAIGIIIAMLTA